jgi:hypothetical protein
MRADPRRPTSGRIELEPVLPTAGDRAPAISASGEYAMTRLA